MKLQRISLFKRQDAGGKTQSPSRATLLAVWGTTFGIDFPAGAKRSLAISLS